MSFGTIYVFCFVLLARARALLRFFFAFSRHFLRGVVFLVFVCFPRTHACGLLRNLSALSPHFLCTLDLRVLLCFAGARTRPPAHFLSFFLAFSAWQVLRVFLCFLHAHARASFCAVSLHFLCTFWGRVCQVFICFFSRTRACPSAHFLRTFSALSPDFLRTFSALSQLFLGTLSFSLGVTLSLSLSRFLPPSHVVAFFCYYFQKADVDHVMRIFSSFVKSRC